MTAFSVVIPNHDQGHLVAGAVDSALAALAHYGGDGEVIVVDDGSTDGSVEVLRRFGDRVRLVVHDRNRGGGAALNTGIARAEGDVVCFLDADDRFRPAKLTTLDRAFGCPGCDWVFHRKHEVVTGRAIPSNRVATADDDIPYDRLWATGELVRAGTLPYLPTSTSCLSVRRDLLATIGRLPEWPGALDDNYLKITALLHADGIFLREELTDVVLHGANSYTGIRRPWALDAVFHARTATDLLRHTPQTRAVAVGMVAGVVCRPDADLLPGREVRAVLRRFCALAGPGPTARLGALTLKRFARRLLPAGGC